MIDTTTIRRTPARSPASCRFAGRGGEELRRRLLVGRRPGGHVDDRLHARQGLGQTVAGDHVHAAGTRHRDDVVALGLEQRRRRDGRPARSLPLLRSSLPALHDCAPSHGASLSHRSVSSVTAYDGTRRGDVTRWTNTTRWRSSSRSNRTHLRAVAYRMLGSRERGRRRRPGGLAAPQPLRHERRREPGRLADDGRRARVPRHAALAQVAARGAAGRARARRRS